MRLLVYYNTKSHQPGELPWFVELGDQKHQAQSVRIMRVAWTVYIPKQTPAGALEMEVPDDYKPYITAAGEWMLL